MDTNRLVSKVRTRWIEPAHLASHRTDGQLVQLDQAEQEPHQHATQRQVPQLIDAIDWATKNRWDSAVELKWRRSHSLKSFPRAKSMFSARDALFASFVPGRARTTTWLPGGNWAKRLSMMWRNWRVIRCRITLFPTFFPTAKAHRLEIVGSWATCKTSNRLEYFLPKRMVLAISDDRLSRRWAGNKAVRPVVKVG